MKREFARAAEALERSRYREFNDGGIGGTAGSLDGYAFPKEWYEGLVARGRGDQPRAERIFETALRLVEADPRQCSSDAKTNSMLGLINATLGRREEALGYGRRAVELLPVSMDAYDGPIMATNLAVIYAYLGERDLALEQLSSLMKVPNGPTPGTLRIETEWDSLRSDPRFQKLL
jgi:tetratricopeptide (TPR) repeat protein